MANTFNIPNISTGPDQVIVGLSTQITVLPVAILVFIWLTFVVGGSLAQRRLSGKMDFPLWNVLGLLSCDLIALFMSLEPGMLNPIVLSVFIGLTFFAGVLLWITRGALD